MKVMCVDGSNYPLCDVCKKADNDPVEGNEYSVSQNSHHDDAYNVEGHEKCFCGRIICYQKDRFIPISEIDETEFERNYNKELA